MSTKNAHRTVPLPSSACGVACKRLPEILLPSAVGHGESTGPALSPLAINTRTVFDQLDTFWHGRHHQQLRVHEKTLHLQNISSRARGNGSVDKELAKQEWEWVQVPRWHGYAEYVWQLANSSTQKTHMSEQHANIHTYMYLYVHHTHKTCKRKKKCLAAKDCLW